MMTDTRKPAADQDADPREADPRADEREGDPGEAISVDDLLRAGAEPAREAGLRNEVAELKDRLLRAMADTENVRRRGEREKAEATLYAASNFARDLLSVADNMSRALEAMPEKARERADEATRNLLAGIDLTYRELMQVFERYNIRRVDPLGERFDPNFHQAMFEVPDPEASSPAIASASGCCAPPWSALPRRAHARDPAAMAAAAARRADVSAAGSRGEG
jgi:molecular chaperone GrpE